MYWRVIFLSCLCLCDEYYFLRNLETSFIWTSISSNWESLGRDSHDLKVNSLNIHSLGDLFPQRVRILPKFGFALASLQVSDPAHLCPCPCHFCIPMGGFWVSTQDSFCLLHQKILPLAWFLHFQQDLSLPLCCFRKRSDPSLNTVYGLLHFCWLGHAASCSWGPALARCLSLSPAYGSELVTWCEGWGPGSGDIVQSPLGNLEPWFQAS